MSFKPELIRSGAHGAPLLPMTDPYVVVTLWGEPWGAEDSPPTVGRVVAGPTSLVRVGSMNEDASL